MPSNFSTWFSEMFKRFGLDSPKYFKIWQTIGLVAIGISFIPDALSYYHIALTGTAGIVLSVALKAGGAALKFMGMLPVSNANAVIDISNKLPFTENAKATGTDKSVDATVRKVQNRPAINSNDTPIK